MMQESSNPLLALLIEHDPDLQEIEALILRDAGFRVKSLYVQENPIHVAQQTTPAVIVIHVDWHDPPGHAVIDQLQTETATRRIPVTIAMAEITAAQSQAAPNVTRAVVAPYDIAALEATAIASLGTPPAAAVLPALGQPIRRSVAFAARALSRDARHIVPDTVQQPRQAEPYTHRMSSSRVSSSTTWGRF
jgi:DNA-binding response OmpR family regulator